MCIYLQIYQVLKGRVIARRCCFLVQVKGNRPNRPNKWQYSYIKSMNKLNTQIKHTPPKTNMEPENAGFQKKGISGIPGGKVHS